VPTRLAPFATLVLSIALLAGCGDSSSEETSTPKAPVGATAKSCGTRAPGFQALRVTGATCPLARRVMHGWQRIYSCASPAGASRHACTAGSYRCASVRTDRGVAVSCAGPGQSVAFISRR
jgi:hypothetical protein